MMYVRIVCSNIKFNRRVYNSHPCYVHTIVKRNTLSEHYTKNLTSNESEDIIVIEFKANRQRKSS